LEENEMASVSNRAYPWRESEQVGPITTVIATNAQLRAGTVSGSVLTYKGYTVMEGFRTSGSVLSGSVLVFDATNANCVSGATTDLPTGPIGVALAGVAANGLVTVITHGVTPKICIGSGAITAGQTVGGAGLSGSNCIAPTTTGGKIVGIAIANIATAATGAIFVLPR